MAKKLKCWKKIRSGSRGELHYNKKSKEYVKISHPFRDVHTVNVYDATNKHMPSLMFEKEFKTKSPSIKHANSYMEKHNKC